MAIDFDKLIEETKKHFLEVVIWRHNASGAFIGSRGDVKIEKGSVCHHFLAGKRAKFIISSLQDGHAYGDNIGRILPKEVELWYLDYILNRSPYSDTFITKDAEKALEERLVVSSGDHPGNLVGGAIVSLRLLWEHTYAAQSAYDLVKSGVDEDIAFLIGHTIQVERRITPGSITRWTSTLNWHTSIDPNLMGIQEIKNFKARKLVSPNDTYSKCGVYTGYCAMYGIDYNSLHNLILTHFEMDSVDYLVKSSNPFTAAVKIQDKDFVGGVSAPYKMAIRSMANWANTFLAEKLKNA